MSVWAGVLAFVIATAAWLAGDPTALLAGCAEVAAVLTLFVLVCAAEAWN